MATVVVPDRLTSHVAAGHPWLYADAVPAVQGAGTGDFVTLLGQGRRPIGHALYDADSPIALRVLTTRKDEHPGPFLWRLRVDQALRLRRGTLDLRTTDAFRLLHGEGDRLPGVVVDHYAGFLVLKLDTPAWLPHLEHLADALEHHLAPRGIFFKGISGEQEPARPLRGHEPPEHILVHEHGMRLQVDVRRGQKTGLFLDQRENRALVRQVSRGRRVLNLFSYTGGFSLAAALGGATQVTSVDLAKAAVEGARLNFSANELDPAAHGFVAADAFDHLAACAAARDQYEQEQRAVGPAARARRAGDDGRRRLGGSSLNSRQVGGDRLIVEIAQAPSPGHESAPCMVVVMIPLRAAV